MMKYYYFILSLLLCSFASNAQSTNEIGQIALSVVMPDYFTDLNESQLSKLETKIAQIVTSAGVSDSGYSNNFVIYPKISINETNVVEGGMQNITVVSADLSLFVKQVDRNILFAAVSKTIKGSGRTKELAITNAIVQISTNDAAYKAFIEKSKTKIISYYESKCAEISNKSDALVKTQQFEQAIGLLMSVPEGTSCYSQIQLKAIEAYKSFQKINCIKQIQLAKNAMAMKEYNETLNLLLDVDPASPCFKEAQSIAKSVESKITDEEKKEWDFQMKQYNDAVGLEKQRVNAVKDIAVAYYKSQTTDVNYTVIVR
jgi:hypothetical protein